MTLEIEKFLDHIDEWKFKLHEELKDMTPAQRKAFWKGIQDQARAMGLRVVEPKESTTKRRIKKMRRTG